MRVAGLKASLKLQVYPRVWMRSWALRDGLQIYCAMGMQAVEIEIDAKLVAD